ncbi:uncharacterized protein LOC133193665 [Saccostrea echinata]|uniref:uncharacterized protein LOC133193665 n=1 Tax=Saccostrea echinata TaxID=191078 RepID=UPI002A801000|nr:uncharacterized protein LOC133193665 [Saccostrea echinata]
MMPYPKFKFFNDHGGVPEPLISTEEFCLYAPLVLCIGTILSLGLGPPIEIDNVLTEILAEHAVSAATLFVCFNIVQVFHPVDSHVDETLESPSSSTSEDIKFTDASSQTEDRNYKMETMLMKQKYDKEIRKLGRESRIVKRKFGKQITDLRRKIESTDKELSSLQLQIPALENERSALLSETDAVDKQLEEEKFRYDTLMTKYEAFHAQLMQSGIASLMSMNFLNSRPELWQQI